MTISSEIDERTLRELYLVPFEAAVQPGRRARRDERLQPGQRDVRAEHRWLLTELLRDEWGFDGVVISDWFGTHSAAESLQAGLDLEMPGPPAQRGDALRAAVRRAARSTSDASTGPSPGCSRSPTWTGAGASHGRGHRRRRRTPAA